MKKKFNGKQDKTGKSKFKGSRAKDLNPKENESANDPSWYIVNEELAKQVASVPFSQYIGADYTMMSSAVVNEHGATTVINSGTTKGTLPSVMMSTYIPWYGKANSASDALSLTTRSFYQFIRHANSGAKNYEAPDLMMYIMAMDNIYLAIGEAKRILRLANTYYLKNRSIPDAILAAMCIDSTDLRKNYITYLARLNIIISRVNTMAVPADFNLFNRRAVLSSAIMTDDVDAPTQVSFYMAAGFYKYEFVNQSVSQASALSYAPRFAPSTNAHNDTLRREKQSLSVLLDTIDELLNAVIEDEDMNIISGDILKAYGDKLFTVAMMDTQESQTFTYDVNMLQQFKNTVYLDAPLDASSAVIHFITRDGTGKEVQTTYPVISQHSGILNCKAVYGTTAISDYWAAYPMSAFYEALREVFPVSCVHYPTPSELMEWTRNVVMLDSNTGEYTAGTEIFLGLYVYIPKGTLNIKTTELGQFAGDYIYQYATHENSYAYRPMVKRELPTTSSNQVSYQIFEAWDVKKTEVYCGYTNPAWATAFIQGLDYGPTTYYYACNIPATAEVATVPMSLNATPILGNIKTNNALLSRANLQAMHDLAISALLYSNFIKG